MRADFFFHQFFTALFQYPLHNRFNMDANKGMNYVRIKIRLHFILMNL